MLLGEFRKEQFVVKSKQMRTITTNVIQFRKEQFVVKSKPMLLCFCCSN